jgi:t-SNARE complex subunit (syntaxin)
MAETSSKWTKLISGAIKFLPEGQWVGIVVELLSHLTSAMGATSGDSKEALKHIESLHTDLTQISAAHTSLAQHLATQAEAFSLYSSGTDTKLDALGVALGQTKLATASVEHRITTLEAAQRRSGLVLKVLCALVVVAIILLVVLLLRQH